MLSAEVKGDLGQQIFKHFFTNKEFVKSFIDTQCEKVRAIIIDNLEGVTKSDLPEVVWSSEEILTVKCVDSLSAMSRTVAKTDFRLEIAINFKLIQKYLFKKLSVDLLEDLDVEIQALTDSIFSNLLSFFKLKLKDVEFFKGDAFSGWSGFTVLISSLASEHLLKRLNK